MSLKHINAKEAKALVDKGAILIDVRENTEYAAENIPGARNAPLSRLAYGPLDHDAPVIVFHCKSGARTRMNARRWPIAPAPKPISSMAASKPGRRPAFP